MCRSLNAGCCSAQNVKIEKPQSTGARGLRRAEIAREGRVKLADRLIRDVRNLNAWTVSALLDFADDFGCERALGELFERGVYVFGIDDDQDRKSTRLNSSHVAISYAVFCLIKKTTRR